MVVDSRRGCPWGAEVSWPPAGQPSTARRRRATWGRFSGLEADQGPERRGCLLARMRGGPGRISWHPCRRCVCSKPPLPRRSRPPPRRGSALRPLRGEAAVEDYSESEKRAAGSTAAFSPIRQASVIESGMYLRRARSSNLESDSACDVPGCIDSEDSGTPAEGCRSSADSDSDSGSLISASMGPAQPPPRWSSPVYTRRRGGDSDNGESSDSGSEDDDQSWAWGRSRNSGQGAWVWRSRTNEERALRRASAGHRYESGLGDVSSSESEGIVGV